MAASWWSWDPRHVQVSRDAVRAAREACRGPDYHLLSRLLAKLEASVKNPDASTRLTKAQAQTLSDCLAGYQSSWAQEVSAIVDQALRLAQDGTLKQERVWAAARLLDVINGKVLS